MNQVEIKIIRTTTELRIGATENFDTKQITQIFSFEAQYSFLYSLKLMNGRHTSLDYRFFDVIY